MEKTIFFIIIGLVVFSAIGYAVFNNGAQEDVVNIAMSNDYKNIAYEIEGGMVVLKDGVSETMTASGSASKIVTKYFGNEAKGDVNNDGIDDIVFLVTQNAGGSGTFYYVVAAITTNNGYLGTNGILLGDRVAPQTTEVRNGIIIVNYAVRKTEEPMSASPSVGKSKYIIVSGTELKEEPIVVFSPKKGEGVSSPLKVTGVAKGNWYFEASFPLEIKDKNGNSLAMHYASAQGEWMTTDYVPFSGEISFSSGALKGQQGVLVVHKDNPSGLPEHDDSRQIPIIFK